MRGFPWICATPAGALLLAVWSLAPARAATVICYSAPENSYGWCAGYNDGNGRICARDYCGDAGGTQCQLAIECDSGWGAIALAEHPAFGFGASCGMADALSARKVALMNCAVASNALCWTDSAFSGNAAQQSEAAKREFDLTWFSQGLLQIRQPRASSDRHRRCRMDRGSRCRALT